jgi:aminodeoxyfutalosine synthase
VESLKTFAVSRQMQDNFPHIKAFWVMHGLAT